MSKDIIIVGNGRQQNSRCPQKLIRKIDIDKTIFDLYMDKLVSLKYNTGYNTIVAIHKNDKELLRIAKNYDIEIVDRNDDSVKPTQTIKELHHFMENYDNKYMMWVNASYPLLKPKTLIDILEYFDEHNGEGLHCIKRVYNWFWKENENKPFNMPDEKKVRTQDVSPIYESMNFCHIFNRKFILDNNVCWTYTKNDPILYLIEKDSIEFLDIDTETDFMMYKGIYSIFEKNDIQ